MSDLVRNKPPSVAEMQLFDLQKQKLELAKAVHDIRAFERKNYLDEKVRKLEIKSQHCSSRAFSLVEAVNAHKDVELMTEQEIRSALIEWKEVWKDLLEKLEIKKEDLELEAIDVDEKNEAFLAFMDNYRQAVEMVSEKVRLLKQKDLELGLYVLAPNKSSDTICYPSIFHGNNDENVYMFVSEFKFAIEASQVRSRDKVKTLLKYLDGDARMSVGIHTRTLEEAFDILIETLEVLIFFGNNESVLLLKPFVS